MGGTPSKKDLNFDPNDWQQVLQSKLNEDEGYIEVKNIKSGQLLDRYQLIFANEKQYNNYMQSVDYRHDEDNIVRVVHYEPKIIKQFCGSSYMLNVYLQHCRSRFSQFQDIPSPDNLYCSIAMLDGYQKLYKKVGRFYVSQNQAMIDQNGKIRVWLNSNFSDNQAEDMRTTINAIPSKNQQYNMSTDETEESNPIKFRDYYEKQKINHDQKVGFIQARNIVYSYAKMNNIQIPQVFTSVLNIYEHGEIEEQQQQTHEDGGGNEEEVEGNQPPRVESHHTNSNTLVSSSFPQTNQVNQTPVVVFPRETSNSGFNYNYQQRKLTPNNFVPVPGSTIRIVNSNSGSHVQPFPISSNSGRGVSPPPPPLTTFANRSTAQPVYFTPIINQQSQVSGFQHVITQPGRSPNIPVSQLGPPVFNQPNYYSSYSPVHPQIYSQANYSHPGSFMIKPSQPIYNIPQQNMMIPSHNRNQMYTINNNIKSDQKQINEKKKKIQLQQDELQIQRKFILKKSSNNHQKYDINSSNKLSQDGNQKNYHMYDQQQLEDQLIKQIQRSRKNRKLQEKHQFDQDNGFRGNSGEINKQYGFRGTAKNINGSTYSQGSQKQANTIQSNSTQFQRFPMTIDHYKQPPLPPQYQNYNSSTNMNQNKKNTNNLIGIQSKRQFYYTLQNEIELDPQIANDLSLYVKS